MDKFYIPSNANLNYRENLVPLVPHMTEFNRVQDRVDASPEVDNFCWNVSVTVFAIILFFFDVATDVNLAIAYWSNGNMLYFSLTLSFILPSSVLISIVSFFGFLRNKKTNIGCRKYHLGIWTLKLIAHLLLMAPVYRNLQSLYFCFMSKFRSEGPEEKNKFRKKMINVDAEVCRLGLIEAFLESAPQLSFQLYIVIRYAQIIRPQNEQIYLTGIPQTKFGHEILTQSFPVKSDLRLFILSQFFSIICSLLSMSVAITNNARYKRYVDQDKSNMTLMGTMFYFLWHFFTIGARVLALVLFTAAFTFWCVVALGIRWFVMSLTLLHMWNYDKDKYSSISNIDEFSFMPPFWSITRAVLIRGPMYLFACVRVHNDPQIKHYLFYYTYEIIECVIFISLWCWVVDIATMWFFWLVMGAYFGGLLLGLSFMFVYFVYFYPETSETKMYMKSSLSW